MDTLESMARTADDRPVVVFDGVCNLCNSSVDFIVRHDEDAVFALAANQSDAAQELLGERAADTDTIALVENGEVHYRSAAVLRIARRLPWPWRMAYGFIVVPRPIRDAAYRFLAKNRYRWFGKKDSCRLPTEAEASRFLT